MEKKYQIGDKTFIQRPLVLGQWRQLIGIAKTIAFPADLDARSLVTAFGEKLFVALAVILTEEGKSPRDKDLDATAAEIEFGMTPEPAIEAIQNFFELNPISSLSSALIESATLITRKMEEIGQMNSASGSAGETSQSGAGSSGMSDLPMPDGGPNAPSGTVTSG